MTISDLKEELKRNPVGLELLKNAKGTKKPEECAAVLADISARCGIEVSQAEILSMIQAEEAERSRRYEAAKEEIAELSDDDVEMVAGGVYYYNRSAGPDRVEGCIHDFSDEDCVLTDACDLFNEVYFGCSSGYYQECKYNAVTHTKV